MRTGQGVEPQQDGWDQVHYRAAVQQGAQGRQRRKGRQLPAPQMKSDDDDDDDDDKVVVEETHGRRWRYHASSELGGEGGYEGGEEEAHEEVEGHADNDVAGEEGHDQAQEQRRGVGDVR